MKDDRNLTVRSTRNFTTAQLYDGEGDLTKRWFVYFFYRDPKSGKKKRFKQYQDLNNWSTKVDRYAAALEMIEALNELLYEGWSPFDPPTTLGKWEAQTHSVQPPTTIEQAIDRVVYRKEREMKPNSFTSWISPIRKFQEWLVLKGFSEEKPESINKGHIDAFLSYRGDQGKFSNTTRNNYLRELRTVFQVMYEQEWISRNPTIGLRKLKQTPTKHRVFTEDQVNMLSKYMEEHDPQLLLYVKMVGYLFLRPTEAARLTVGDIDLKKKWLRVDTKMEKGRIRVIPEVIIPDLVALGLENYEKEDILFTNHGKPGKWSREPRFRRQWMSRRFQKMRDDLGLDSDYTLYSYRHTFVSNLYNSFLKEGLSDFEIRSKILPITGHGSIQSLEYYLRTIPVRLPEDYSDRLGFKL